MQLLLKEFFKRYQFSSKKKSEKLELKEDDTTKERSYQKILEKQVVDLFKIYNLFFKIFLIAPRFRGNKSLKKYE